jgi:hypothetical protein
MDSMLSFKQIEILSLNYFFIIASLPLEYKEVFVKLYRRCTHNISKQTKNEKEVEARTKNKGKGLELIFFKELETNYHSSSSCVCYVAPFTIDA